MEKYSVYLFENNPQVTGLTIDEEVHTEIKKSDLTLVFLSENSQGSLRWINKEIGLSEGMGKPLVYIVAEKETPQEVIDVTKRVKYIKFDKAKGITQEFLDTLKKSLHTELGQKRLVHLMTWVFVIIGFGLYMIFYRKE